MYHGCDTAGPVLGQAFFKNQQDELAFGVVPAYRRYELYQARYHELVPVVAPLLKRSSAPLRILDIGSGEGPAKQFIDRLAGKAEWTAIEINEKRAAQCEALGYGQVVRQLDLEKEPLPFADGNFDVVIASHVLEHLETADRALADWMRVVRPGGALLLGVPMHLGPIAALARLKYRLFGRRPRGHCHFFSMRSLRKFLSPYQVERIWGFRFLSARQQLPLEDWEWFYRLSLLVGDHFPGACAEVNVHLTKPR